MTEDETGNIFKKTNYSNEFLNRMNQLRIEETLCDVTLKVDGKSFLAHRNVLSISSKYFRRMFTIEMQEKNNEEVIIENVEATIFEKILNYIYTGCIKINEKNVVMLWITLDYFQLLNARDMCANFLAKDLQEQIQKKQNEESFFDLWEIRNSANVMGNKNLVSTVEKLIGCDFKELMMSEEFLKLNTQELCDLIGSDDLFTETEENIFEAVVNWIEYSEEERIKYLPEAFAKIRLNLMSRKFLIDKVSDHCFIKKSEQCRNIIHLYLKKIKEGSVESSRSFYSKQTGEIYVIGETSHAGTMLNHKSNENREMEAKRMSSSRTNMGVAVVKGRIYIFCIEGPYNRMMKILDYNAETNEWSESCSISMSSRPVVVTSEYCIYVCGGFLDIGTHNYVEYFNPESKSWSTLPSMETFRCGAVAVLLNNFIYVMGGFDVKNFALNSVERFDIKNRTWEYVNPMSIARAHFGAAILDGKIYVFGGGKNSKTLAEVEVYDPQEGKWELMESIILKRTDLRVVSNVNEIWAIGGTANLEVED